MRPHRLLPLVLPLALAACGDEPAAPDLPSSPALATTTVQASEGALGRPWDGVIEAVRQATLRAQTSGRVVSVDVDVDDHAAAGQVLLRLSSVEQEAEAESARARLRSAEAAATEAEANYRRFAALAPGQYVSRAQIDQVRAARDGAIAARDAARAQLAQAGQQTEYTMVRAPFAGIVSARDVEPGESVTPTQKLLSLYAPDALRIEVLVPQSDAAAIRAAKRASIVLNDGRRFEAAQVVVFPAADPSTHSVAVRIVLPLVTDAPAPGNTAKVAFPIDGGDAVLRVPVSSLTQRGDVSGVYVLTGRDHIGLRQVRLGRRVGDEVEVVAGLEAGERIAVNPVAAGRILAARRRTAGEAAHD